MELESGMRFEGFKNWGATFYRTSVVELGLIQNIQITSAMVYGSDIERMSSTPLDSLVNHLPPSELKSFSGYVSND